MPEDACSSAFMPLGDWVRKKNGPCALTRAEEEKAAPEPIVPAERAELLSFIEEAALLRLRVVESFERSRRRLLERFAEDVFARELQTSPADIEEIARKASAAFAQECPATLIVSPADAARLRVDASVRVDASLEDGDIIVDIPDGRFESPLRLRFMRELEETLREEAL